MIGAQCFTDPSCSVFNNYGLKEVESGTVYKKHGKRDFMSQHKSQPEHTS